MSGFKGFKVRQSDSIAMLLATLVLKEKIVLFGWGEKKEKLNCEEHFLKIILYYDKLYKEDRNWAQI